MKLKISKKAVFTTVASLAILGAVIGTSVVADAQSRPAAKATPAAAAPVAPGNYTVCAKDDNNVPVRIYSSIAGCSTGYHAVRWSTVQPKDQVVSMAPVGPTVLHNVGGSIRTGVTDLGSVTLDAGTYNAQVLATFFRKVNTSTDPAFANIQTYGTLVVWTGDAIQPDFSNDLTVGGVLIPKVNSTTLTIDPSANLVSTLKIADDGTPVHIGVFAYDDNSGSEGTTGQPGEGDFSAALQSATFTKLNV